LLRWPRPEMRGVQHRPPLDTQRCLHDFAWRSRPPASALLALAAGRSRERRAPRHLRGSPRRRASDPIADRADVPAFPRPRVRATGRRGTDPPPRFDSARGVLTANTRALLIATCGARHAVGRDVVITVGPNALLSFWRGCTAPEAEARPRPRIDLPRGLMAKTRPRPGSRQTRDSAGVPKSPMSVRGRRVRRLKKAVVTACLKRRDRQRRLPQPLPEAIRRLPPRSCPPRLRANIEPIVVSRADSETSPRHRAGISLGPI
jgi:hypothetical protein